MTAELAETDPRDEWGEQRSKVVTWHDPGPTTAKGLSMAGIDYFRAMIDGVLPGPPIAGLMEFAMTEAEPGRVVFTCRPDESAYNPIGAVHGGMFATLLDSAAGCAVHSLLPAGVGYTSLDLTVKFVHAITVESGASGPLRCVGTVTHLGGRTALAQAELRGPDGRLYATAVSSLLILRPLAGTAGAVTE